MLRTATLLMTSLLALGVFILFPGHSGAYYVDPKEFGSPAGEVCVICHREVTPGIYNQWIVSAMGQAGVNCYDCHKAEKNDPDAFEHKELIAIVVTPKDCSRCHEKEFKEYTSSHHADAAGTLNSIDNFFGRAIWGADAAKTGCVACHGSTLKLQKEGKGKLEPSTWPNTGIGRINLDGSKGSCTACHPRHFFALEQARRPETCGRCHNGPENPHFEIYSGSKHGMMYNAYRTRMNMDRRRWRAGIDYFQGPTCASCHMGAVPPQMEVKDADQRLEEALKSVLSGVEGKEFEALLPPPRKAKRLDYGATHDVGSRLSWNLRRPVSERQRNWEEKRALMQSVCTQCHGENFVKQFYSQFDGLIAQYDERVSAPATRIRKALINMGKLTSDNFDDKLDKIYWKLVYFEGKRARHGAAMMGANYAWSQGMQEVSEGFYFEFIPEVKRILGRKADSFLRHYGYTEPESKK
jgi:hydroxylamine dehydrogenase